MNDTSNSLEVSKKSTMWFGSPKLCIRKSTHAKKWSWSTKNYSPTVMKSRQQVCLEHKNSNKIQGISRSKKEGLGQCCVK